MSKPPIKGIGNDIVEIDRIQKAIDEHGDHFVNRLFTDTEQKYCYQHKNPTPSFAARFAAKEAIVKALGIGFGEKMHWKDLEIVKEESGKPYVKFTEDANQRLNFPQILISMSHSDHYATATAIWID